MNDTHFKVWFDITSISTVIATIVGWLPPIAAIASIVWTFIQIYDWYSKRGQKNGD